MNPARLPLPALALILLSAAPALCSPLPLPAEEGEEGTAVTVYSAPEGYDPNQVQNVYDPRLGRWVPVLPGFSVVKQRFRLDLEAGVNTLRHEDVAAGIDASTVLFRSLTDPGGTKVVEQSFEYDLADANRVLEKYVGREISLRQADGVELRGRLLSFDAVQVVLQTDRGLQILRRGENLRGIETGPLPDNFVTKPTLVWLLHAGKAGSHLAEIAYETADMSWTADYTAVVNADETAVDLSAWVTIRNQSGATYRDAALKLVAGDLNRAPRPGSPYDGLGARSEFKAGASAPAGFTEKAFFEYHLYTLGRRTTLPDRSLKQIELFDPAAGVPCRKVYLYDGLRDLPWWGGRGPNQDQNFGDAGSRKVGVYLEIENRRENGLGMPLPAGRMRVHKRDEADGFPELVGEDRIGHTPKDERVRLKVGDAFDIVGERRQTDFKCDYSARWIRETVEVRVRNHKDEAVEVLVAERLYRWVNWEIEKADAEFVKVDSRLVHFPVTVARDGEAVFTYTVKYTW